jgi:diguanylate cyclase (GGDEF)-like protein/PAS domain S-box-containing protein
MPFLPELFLAPALTAAQVRTRAVWICGLATVVMALAALQAPTQLFTHRAGDWPAVHLLLELVSVLVSVMVVSMAWHNQSPDHAHMAKALVFGFTVVAGVDVLHALAYEGMPSLLTEASTPKAIFLWLAGRSFEVVTVWLVAMRVPLPGGKGLWLGLGLACVAALLLLSSHALAAFPTTFVPGQGLTPFKVGAELVLCAAHLLAAGWLFWQARRMPGSTTPLWLGTACFVMGVGELAFTGYDSPSDFINVFGHLYKIAAFWLIYRVTFQITVHEPYAALHQAAERLREQKRELDTVLNNVPVGVSHLDTQLRYLYVNPVQAARLGRQVDDIVGVRFDAVLPPEIMGVVHPKLQQALGGQAVSISLRYTGPNGLPVVAEARVVPQRTERGTVAGLMAIVTDTSERERTHQKLLESVREISDLTAALDAHAIVAVTDAQGVITRVNDKFCSISKYPRSELLGRTHRVINSGQHPRGFFEDLWATISGGRVWNGEICNRAKDGSLYWVYTTIVPFVGPDGLPVQYIAIRADITERKKAEEEAQRMAFFDALTGLPNRRLVAERLNLALLASGRSGEFGALVLLDLDHFKEVNDTLGHFQGDELLRQVSLRLQNCVRQTDTVARLGGDEFVLVLNGLGDDLADATARAGDLSEKVRETLAMRYHFNGLQVDITASVGVVMFLSTALPVDELLKQADMALYRAKAAGRNRVAFFDPALQDEVNARAALLRDLREAQERQTLKVHYQPVVTAGGGVLGVEALLRWPHPTKGAISPAQFIPLAEQTGLILPIGKWVLQTACEQLVAWAAHPTRQAWSVAVNVSARQFKDPDFVQHVTQTLADTGANPQLLRLELTESMLHSDIPETIEKMTTLRALGVRFSLDDFGTGYSSLSYLKRLPLDQLKIDQSFVRDVLTDPNDAAIACTILSLAESLGLNVVAEGVETAEQLLFLLGHGCASFQGYLFGRPVPADQLPDR